MTGPTAIRLASITGLLVIWWGVSLGVGDDALPSPMAVAEIMVRETLNGELLRHLAATLLRVVAAFVIAMSIGALAGYAMGRSRTTDRVLDPWLILMLNLPALVTIVLAYIWIGLNEVAAVLAVAINKIPNVAVTVREGARALDPALDEMARVYRFSRRDRLMHVVLPQLQPYFAAASRSGIALIWKIVLVVELLGRPNGVGFQIATYFSLFDVAAILAYAAAFILVMLAIEFAVLQPYEQRARRWRGVHV